MSARTKTRTKNDAKARANRRKARMIARQQEETRQVLSDHFIAYVPNTDDCLYSFNDKGEYVPFGEKLQWSLEITPIKWTVNCFVFCRDQNGQQYTKQFAADAVQPCKRRQVMAKVADQLVAFVEKDVNPLHFLAVGWIATIYRDPEPEAADKMFDKIDVWSQFKTQWEDEQEKEDGLDN